MAGIYYWRRMFRLVTIVVRSFSFDQLVYRLVSSYVETKRVTTFSVFTIFSQLQPRPLGSKHVLDNHHGRDYCSVATLVFDSAFCSEISCGEDAQRSEKVRLKQHATRFLSALRLRYLLLLESLSTRRSWQHERQRSRVRLDHGAK